MTEPQSLPIATPPGWYVDPVNQRQRWWDGIQCAFFDDTGAAPALAAFPSPPQVVTNGMATASLVLGIVGFVLCMFLLPSALAVVFGIVGIVQADSRDGFGRGKAVAGLVLGALGLLLAATVIGR